MVTRLATSSILRHRALGSSPAAHVCVCAAAGEAHTHARMRLTVRCQVLCNVVGLHAIICIRPCFVLQPRRCLKLSQ